MRMNKRELEDPRKCEQSKKTPALTAKERAQRWVEMKKLPMPRLLHPVSGAKLLPDERIEYVRDRFILVEGDASAPDASRNIITCTFGKPLSDSQCRDIGNFKTFLKTKAFVQLYAQQLVDEVAAAKDSTALKLIQVGGRQTHIPINLNLAKKKESGPFFLRMLLFSRGPFNQWSLMYPFIKHILPLASVLPPRGQELKDQYLAALAADDLKNAVSAFASYGHFSLSLDETTTENCESLLGVIALGPRGAKAVVAMEFLERNNAQHYLAVFRKMADPSTGGWSSLISGALSCVDAIALDNSSVNVKFMNAIHTAAPTVIFLPDKLHLGDATLGKLFEQPILSDLISLSRRYFTVIAKLRRQEYANWMRGHKALLPLVDPLDETINAKRVAPAMPPGLSDVRWLSRWDRFVFHRARYDAESTFFLEYVKLNSVRILDPEEDDEDKKGAAALVRDIATFYADEEHGGAKLAMDVLFALGEPLASFMTRFQGTLTPLFPYIFDSGEALDAHFWVFKHGFAKGRGTQEWLKLPSHLIARLEALRATAKPEHQRVLDIARSATNDMSAAWRKYWREGAQQVAEAIVDQQMDAYSSARVFDRRLRRNEQYQFKELMETFTWPWLKALDQEQLEREYDTYMQEEFGLFPDNWTVDGFWSALVFGRWSFVVPIGTCCDMAPS
jgi:hypothetical protein